MNEQKEMLIELLKEALPENPLRGNNCTCRFPDYEEIAERLLDRIVVLPYKPGTTVYEVKTRTVFDDSIPGNSRAESYVEKAFYDPKIFLNGTMFYSARERAEKMADYLNKARENRR